MTMRRTYSGHPPMSETPSTLVSDCLLRSLWLVALRMEVSVIEAMRVWTSACSTLLGSNIFGSLAVDRLGPGLHLVRCGCDGEAGGDEAHEDRPEALGPILREPDEQERRAEQERPVDAGHAPCSVSTGAPDGSSCCWTCDSSPAMAC